MKRDEILFDTAVQAMQATELDAIQVAASARRVAARLGLDATDAVPIEAIEGCDDVRLLFAAYRAGSLPRARALLIEAHIHDCSACRHQFRNGAVASGLDWSTPKAARVFVWHPRAYGWSLASAFALLACTFFFYRAYWQVPPGVRAEVQSIDGAAYRISDSGDRILAPGDKLVEGERVRTSGGAHAVLQLADGSTVEVNERDRKSVV